jgi:carboxypeptidase D
VELKDQGQVFYWLFPRMEEVPTKNSKLSSENPLLIHIPGGPGVSIMDIIFEASGPFVFKHVNKVGNNPYSWSKLANVLYIDWPLGSGFSTVNKEWGYPRKPIMDSES